MTLLLTVILVAVVFEYINGFHDTANSIATVVSTKVLPPRLAIVLATMTNLVGALMGTAVAKTVTSGLVNAEFVNSHTIVCALLGAIVWNLLTWWFGLPSSSTHALVGGLCGATFATSHGQWASIIWSKPVADAPWWKYGGVLYKVIIPMLTSPLVGFAVGLIMMSLLYLLLENWKPSKVNKVFGRLQLVSAAYMGWSHGLVDAQKTMGIITLALVAATKAGALEGIPESMAFLRQTTETIPFWIKGLCAVVMAAGTAAGGWRIIKTMGHQMVRLQPVHGFAAETTAASVLFLTGHFGMTVSTTHAITTSIMGVGCARRWNALKFPVVRRILWAWVLTIPATAFMSYFGMRLAQLLGW